MATAIIITQPVIPMGEPVYAKRVDNVTNEISYVGEAMAGGDESLPIWRIKRVFIDNNDDDVIITWADGDILFDNVWDDRLTLSYV